MFFVLAIILARGGEKAKWISQPSCYTDMFLNLGTEAMMIGAVYADADLLRDADITSSRLRHVIVLAVALAAVMLWSLRKRPAAARPPS